MGGSGSKFPAFKGQLPRMDGKTAVITGTTSGTGYIAAQTMARRLFCHIHFVLESL